MLDNPAINGSIRSDISRVHIDRKRDSRDNLMRSQPNTGVKCSSKIEIHTLSNNSPFSCSNSLVMTRACIIFTVLVTTFCEHNSKLTGSEARVLMHHSVPVQLTKALSGAGSSVSLKTVRSFALVMRRIPSAASAAVASKWSLCFSITSTVRARSLTFFDGTWNPHATEKVEPKGI